MKFRCSGCNYEQAIPRRDWEKFHGKRVVCPKCQAGSVVDMEPPQMVVKEYLGGSNDGVVEPHDPDDDGSGFRLWSPDGDSDGLDGGDGTYEIYELSHETVEYIRVTKHYFRLKETGRGGMFE